MINACCIDLDVVHLRTPVIRLPMFYFIVDPMLHCLQLNNAKTLWKYCFGDRMLEPHRERVAEYLDSIDCALDVRAKAGSRNPEQKSTFQLTGLSLASRPQRP
eukprot:6183666-Pleurochrysis_carterae.AAC.2